MIVMGGSDGPDMLTFQQVAAAPFCTTLTLCHAQLLQDLFVCLW